MDILSYLTYRIYIYIYIILYVYACVDRSLLLCFIVHTPWWCLTQCLQWANLVKKHSDTNRSGDGEYAASRQATGGQIDSDVTGGNRCCGGAAVVRSIPLWLGWCKMHPWPNGEWDGWWHWVCHMSFCRFIDLSSRSKMRTRMWSLVYSLLEYEVRLETCANSSKGYGTSQAACPAFDS